MTKRLPTIFGAVIFIAGVIGHIPRLNLPQGFDTRQIAVTFGEIVFSLDVILIIVGTGTLIVTWVFSKLLGLDRE